MGTSCDVTLCHKYMENSTFNIAFVHDFSTENTFFYEKIKAALNDANLTCTLYNTGNLVHTNYIVYNLNILATNDFKPDDKTIIVYSSEISAKEKKQLKTFKNTRLEINTLEEIDTKVNLLIALDFKEDSKKIISTALIVHHIFPKSIFNLVHFIEDVSDYEVNLAWNKLKHILHFFEANGKDCNAEIVRVSGDYKIQHSIAVKNYAHRNNCNWIFLSNQISELDSEFNDYNLIVAN